MHYSTRPKFAQFRKFVKPEVKKYVFIAFERIACKKGLTQTQLAKKAGVSVGNVGDWESGKSKPGITHYPLFHAFSRYRLIIF